jgi:hypothetical protein
MTIQSKKNKKVFLTRSKKVKRVNIKKGGNPQHPKHFYYKEYDNIIKRYNEVYNEIIIINRLIYQAKPEKLDELGIRKKLLEQHLLKIKMENSGASWYIDYCKDYFQYKIKKELDDLKIQNISQKDIKDLIETNKECIFKLISKPISKKVDIEKFKKYDNSENSGNVSKQNNVLDTDILEVKLQNQKRTEEHVFTLRGDTTIAKLKILLAEKLQIPPYKIYLEYESNVIFNYNTIATIQYNQTKYIQYQISTREKPHEVSSEKPDVTYEYVSAAELIERFNNEMEIDDKVKFTRFLKEMNLTPLFNKIKKGVHTVDEYKEFLKIIYINNFVEKINIDSSLCEKDIEIPVFKNVKPEDPPHSKLYLVKELNDMNNQLFRLNSKVYSLKKNSIKNKDEIEQNTFMIQALLTDIDNFITKNEDIYDYVINLRKYQMINKNEPAQYPTKSPIFSRRWISNFFTDIYYTIENTKMWRYITADEIRIRIKLLNSQELTDLLQQIKIMDHNAYLIINKIRSNTESLEDTLTLYNILIQQISFKIIELLHGGDEMDFNPLSLIT